MVLKRTESSAFEFLVIVALVVVAASTTETMSGAAAL
jgi:hypothetical protein